MKTWKIITVAGFALIEVALLTASAFAYMGGRGFYSPYGTNTGVNTAYGGYGGMMGGGMMGGYGYGIQTGPITVTVDQAKANAQQFLSVNYPGTTVGGVDTLYGYYHVDVLQSGTTYGMLSVNGYTGQVWYHT